MTQLELLYKSTKEHEQDSEKEGRQAHSNQFKFYIIIPDIMLTSSLIRS